MVADVREWTPTKVFDLWHYRAAFHFMKTNDDKAAHLGGITDAIRPGGIALSENS